METERVALSQRERDRLKVLHEVDQEHLTQVVAAERLKVTDRGCDGCCSACANAGTWPWFTDYGTALEPQVGPPIRAENPGACTSAVCRFRTHAGRRTPGPRGFSTG
jgi:hypothetical protein